MERIPNEKNKKRRMKIRVLGGGSLFFKEIFNENQKKKKGDLLFVFGSCIKPFFHLILLGFHFHGLFSFPPSSEKKNTNSSPKHKPQNSFTTKTNFHIKTFIDHTHYKKKEKRRKCWKSWKHNPITLMFHLSL